MARLVPLIVGIAALAAALTGCAYDSGHGAHGDTGTASEFQALIDGYYRAWTVPEGRAEQVPAAASRYYAKDAGLVFYDLRPMEFVGWAEYETGVMTHLINGMVSTTFTPNNDLHVTRHGDIAWTTVTFHATAQLKVAGDLAFDGRHTAVWERRGGRWLIVHEHLSVPMPP